MTKLRELYYCSICKNVTEVVHEGAPALVCCGKPMQKLEAKNSDTGLEKHVPVVTEKDNGIHVCVGSINHPMTEEHSINFIEVLTENKVLRAELKPNDKPEAYFNVCPKEVKQVRAYCNLHGLWKA
ncbi:desulfoferrodoxin [Clostridium sp. 'deep sea']|uniref:desulfoferrodoxin n=1 Tax=Clostridium sp. 'deep sea' TaxID=2779445 RepID=UPI00189686F1|nr:desulfoferrodoxin [Clostridium sp. 'deep sea']QOR34025.1 desulfoferrodoxin [Clostridium sp. 'deep sea']